MSKSKILAPILALSLLATAVPAVMAQDETVTDEEITAAEILEAGGGEPIEITEPEIEELALLLEQLRLGIQANSELLDSLDPAQAEADFHTLRERVGHTERRIENLNVDRLRARVLVNEGMLKEVVSRYSTLSANVKAMNKQQQHHTDQLAHVKRQLVQLQDIVLKPGDDQ